MTSIPMRASGAVCDAKRAMGGRRLRVLTLTPFYPAMEDGSQGGFVADPLNWMEPHEIVNQVIAVRPFYRRRLHSVSSETSSVWASYFSVPGNWGLPTAGAFLAAGLMKAICRMHRLREFDLIHAHGALPCGHAAMLIGRNLQIPFVVSVHGLDAFQDEFARTRALGAWRRRISEEVYRSAAKVICISERVREQLGELRGAAEVIYNGVDAELFCPGQELKPGLTVLSVGNLIPIKGHALLLRAFARISGDFPEASLEIFGDGPERVGLLALARQLGISGRVRFQGRQGRAKIAEAMRRCAVFALPSGYEGLGCVYLEAMASGKPAIGCRGQGIEEIIEHGKNGFLVSPGNEAELSECLRVLLQNEDFRRRMGTSGRSTILQRHTLSQQAQELTDLYRECVR